MPRPPGIELSAPTRELDLTDAQSIARAVAAERWSAVIDAAAYTEVDPAESEERTPFAVNALAASRLAAATADLGTPPIRISTDYMFNGRKGAPYVEPDDTGPVNAYGRSKLAGEAGVRGANTRHLVLRASWVYSSYRKTFVKTILRLAAERDHLTVVNDQHGRTTAAYEIAKAYLDVAVACASRPASALRRVSFFGRGRSDLVRLCHWDRRNGVAPSRALTRGRSPEDSRIPHARPIHASTARR